MTKLAACHASTQTVVADTNGLVLEAVGKVILSLGHRAHEHANAFVGGQRIDVIPHSHHISVEAECDFSAFRREMVCDGVLDDFE